MTEVVVDGREVAEEKEKEEETTRLAPVPTKR